jgi:hypothetical protein
MRPKSGNGARSRRLLESPSDADLKIKRHEAERRLEEWGGSEGEEREGRKVTGSDQLTMWRGRRSGRVGVEET